MFILLAGSAAHAQTATPFGGVPVQLPGTIEVEDFDEGGEGIAYHDLTPYNEGGGYRATDVDLQPTSDAGGGYNLGWVSAGEWLAYTVNVAAAGLYTVEFRLASMGPGGDFHIEVNGNNATGPLNVGDSRGWQNWFTATGSDIPLSAGIQHLKLVMDTAGASGAVGNFNWMRFTLASPQSTPFTGTPVVLPGMVEAEDFDNGGPGVAYFDDSPGNSGGAYRATDVDLEPAADTSGGYNVGWVSAGEWLNYTVNVGASGLYTLEVRVASPGAGGSFHLEANGVNITGSIAVPDTGGWQAWSTVERAGMALTSGIQTWRLVMDTAGASGAVGNFNWFNVVGSEQIHALKIISPAPGSSLLATSVTFRWEGAGDEFRLMIGRTLGSADVYASGPLGPTTKEHTVSGLPLNGQTLYVEVQRRTGDVIDSVRAQYTAAVRKGLAIITDFANRRLEDWTGLGLTSVDDLSAQLWKMEQHWAWLSRGLEAMRWDIIRVQLPQPAVPEAYPNWGAFRDEAITLAREQVRTEDYDVNADGVIDAAWLIVSSGSAQLPFVVGGASRNAGANLFVDGQTGGSINAGATGNFNHELGHCLGLPDMYGSYGTMSSLTVMSNSWPLPPPDFSAYERLKLGWLTPQVVSATTQGILLPSANDQLAAVKVPTNKPYEYFLIEYRRRPSSGFGSEDVYFNGLGVYHVLEGSSMSQDPPILKLEPADGNILPSRPTDPNDFYSPDNPWMIQPGVFFSYFGEGQEVFRLGNLVCGSYDQDHQCNGDFRFDITIAGPQPSSNLLANGSFEAGQAGVPQSWSPDAWVAMPGAFRWPAPIALTGVSSAQLDVPTDNDVRWVQPVTTLVTGQTYMLCGWLKGEQIAGSGNVGANVSVMGGFVQSEGLLGTFDWTQRCVSFTAETPRVDVACRVGFYGSTNSGQLWCDDFTLEHLRRAF
jgi:hypothetical protein